MCKINQIILLFSAFVAFYSCAQKGKVVTKAEMQQDYLADLRERYSSGDYTKWPKPNVDATVLADGFEDIGLLPPVVFPDGNPYSREKYALGKLLFFDPRLSSSGQVACATCHDSQLGWGDGKRVPFGHNRQKGRRNSMSLFNVAYYKKLFWDGRALSLEHQATMPIEDPLEMHDVLENVVRKISEVEGYEKLFTAAYGDNKVTRARIVKAIATFERKLVSPKSRFDLFVRGDSSKLSDDEVFGLHVFRTKGRCLNCHNTPLFSDAKFHNDGQALWGSRNEDLGRYNVTKDPKDVGKFKTPSLRETTNTGPWMHNGNFPSLRDVILFYSLGNPEPIQKKYLGTPRDSLLPTRSPLLKRLDLSEREIQALEAFLHSITTTPRLMRAPKLPE